jgi:hypothetical protein
MTFPINEGRVISFILKGAIGKEGPKKNKLNGNYFIPLLGILSGSRKKKIAKKMILKVPTNTNL